MGPQKDARHSIEFFIGVKISAVHINLSFETKKKWLKFIYYYHDFVINVIVVTEFDCYIKMLHVNKKCE